MRWLMAGSACVLASAVLLALVHVSPRQAPGPSPVQRGARAVACKCGSEVECVMGEAGGRGMEPVVLKGTCVSSWPAMKRWASPEYLLAKAPANTAPVYRNSHRTFGPYFDHRRPLAHLVTPRNNYETNVELKTATLLQRMRGESRAASEEPATPSTYLYFSGEAELWGEWVLEDVEPFMHLLALNPRVSSINLWVGEPHVKAHCHYDGYHNFYAQVVGRKRFHLYPPTSWPFLKPFPFLHPSHAQCQTNLTATDSQARSAGITVDLEPGDLLFLPPLYFHEVEALDFSVSINFWTDTQQTLAAEKLFAVPWAAHLQKTGDDRVSLLARTILFVDEFLGQCHTAKGSEESRMRSMAAFVCDLYSARLASGREALKLTNAEKQLAKSACSHARNFPQATFATWTGNWIEALIASIVGPEATGCALRSICASQSD